MTKEETLTYLKAYLDGDTAIGNIIPLRSVLESALEYLEPSLPSNLDEAANDYGVNARFGYPRVMDETDKYIYKAFKAGAEWMAGQGISCNCEITKDFGIMFLKEPFERAVKEMEGNVIVQIKRNNNMERQERKVAAEKYAAKYVHNDVRREVEKAFFAGCDFESAGEFVKGKILETEFDCEQKIDGKIITSFPDGYLDFELYGSIEPNLFKDGDEIEILIRKKITQGAYGSE